MIFWNLITEAFACFNFRWKQSHFKGIKHADIKAANHSLKMIRNTKLKMTKQIILQRTKVQHLQKWITDFIVAEENFLVQECDATKA